MRELSKNLKRLHKHSPLSQREVADRLGINHTTYNHWVNGITDIKSDFIPKIAEIFEIEIQDLFNTGQSSQKIVNFSINKTMDNTINNGFVIVLTDKDDVNKIKDIIASAVVK